MTGTVQRSYSEALLVGLPFIHLQGRIFVKGTVGITAVHVKIC